MDCIIICDDVHNATRAKETDNFGLFRAYLVNFEAATNFITMIALDK